MSNETNMSGDCAKLREALKDIGRLVEQIHFLYSDYPSEIHEIARKVNSTVAEPPRNCDIGTAEEQEKRFHDFCRARHLPRTEDSSYCAYKCPLEGDTCCELQWAQMPYEAEKGGV